MDVRGNERERMGRTPSSSRGDRSLGDNGFGIGPSQMKKMDLEFVGFVTAQNGF